MADTTDEKDECEIATEAAMEVALEECTPGQRLSNIGRMTGVGNPDPEDVPEVLGVEDCMEMGIVREWVAVRADDLVEEGMSLTDAIEQAWEEAHDQCGW